MENRNRTRRRALFAAECCALAWLTAILIWPLFRIEYLDNWGSIDSTFIAAARFLREHWPHPRWMPLWYCGTRFDHLYPPALPYGTALLSALFQVSTARAYHLYTALFYCLGTAGTYALVRVASGSRAWAAIAAAATALVSPSYLFLKSFRDDSFLHMPQRLNVLVKWGEGPHMTALACLPFALVFSWLGIRDGNRRWLGLAAVCCALVVSNNFYGAMALALLFPPLVWALWITHRRMARRSRPMPPRSNTDRMRRSKCIGREPTPSGLGRGSTRGKACWSRKASIPRGAHGATGSVCPFAKTWPATCSSTFLQGVGKCAWRSNCHSKTPPRGG
jgi:hypothetical protein